jgi:hypothetical protein
MVRYINLDLNYFLQIYSFFAPKALLIFKPSVLKQEIKR